MRIRWVDELRSVKVALRGNADTINLLDPQSPVRRRRWTEVIGAYRACSQAGRYRSAATLRTGVILAARELWGCDTEEILQALHLRAEKVVLLEDHRTIPRLLARERHPTATVIAQPQQLSTRFIRELAAQAAASRVRIGCLTATDLASLIFVGLKMRIAWCPLPTDQTSDRNGECRPPLPFMTNLTCANPISPAAREFEHWSVVSARGHGDGAHIDLEQGVLCGFHDLPAGGQRDEIGCGNDFCQRSGHRSGRFMRAAETRGRLVALSSCNSANVAGQVIGRTRSLALASLDGWANAVIASPVAIDSRAAERTAILTLAGRWDTAQELTAEMNTLAATPAQELPYVLLGLPEMPLRPPEAALIELPKDDVLDPSQDKMRKESDLASLAEATRIAARGVFRSMRYEVELAVEDRNEELIGVLRNCRVELALLVAMAGRLISNRAGSDAGRLLLEQLTRAIQAWDTAFANVMSDTLIHPSHGRAPMPGLLVSQTLFRSRRSAQATCPRCGEDYDRERHVSLDEADTIVLDECSLCGPLGCGREDGARLHVDGPSLWQKDDVPEFNILARLPGRRLVPGHLLVQHRDMSKPGLAKPRMFPGSSRSRRFVCDLDPDAGFDQHDIRVVLVCRLEVAFARVPAVRTG